METPTKTALALATQAGDRTAFGLYRREAGTDVSQLFGLLVLSVEGEQIASLVAFLDLSSLSSFAFPATLAGSPT
jgi:RNA polymerase sigma-70 factor (ECF subfamily)